MIIDPKHPKAKQLKDWYHSEQLNKEELVSVSIDLSAGNFDMSQANERLLVEVDELLHNEFQKNPSRGVFFTINCYISNIKSDDKCIYNS